VSDPGRRKPVHRWDPPCASRLPSFVGRLLLLGCGLLLLGCGQRGAALEPAQAAWDRGDYAGAAARYEEFLKEHPHHEQAAAARFQAGNIYFLNLRQYERAIQHYIHLIEDFPSAPQVTLSRQRLAESYVALGKPREAINEYERLLRASPDFPDRRRVRLSIADLYYDQNDLGQALAEYEKVTSDAAYDELAERAYLRIGGINFLRDEFEAASQAYQEVAAQTRDPQLRRQARFGLADCYERTFRYDEAVKILEQTERDPQTPDYIPKRIAQMRERERERQLAQPLAQSDEFPVSRGLPGRKP
jgi:tetratricopeptide (TPR) repeat protein